MKPITATLLALALAAGTLPLACSSGDEPLREERTVPATEMAAPLTTDSFSGPSTAPADAEAMPDRVYYVLTDFDWYARGEPVVLEGTSYTVAGDPIRIDARTLERVAEYGGVELYRRNGDAHLYVPVFSGYWLGFAPDPSAPAPAIAPPDSTAAA